MNRDSLKTFGKLDRRGCVMSFKVLKRTIGLWLLCMGILFLFGCQEGRVSQGFAPSKYSKKEIELMMKYHGSLIAKFDGRRWWCLQGRRWIKIDSAKAAHFAQVKLSKKRHSQIY